MIDMVKAIEPKFIGDKTEPPQGVKQINEDTDFLFRKIMELERKVSNMERNFASLVERAIRGHYHTIGTGLGEIAYSEEGHAKIEQMKRDRIIVEYEKEKAEKLKKSKEPTPAKEGV